MTKVICHVFADEYPVANSGKCSGGHVLGTKCSETSRGYVLWLKFGSVLAAIL